MSCCGEPKVPQDASNREVSNTQSFINQQPSGQAGLEKHLFEAPSISTLPPAHSYSQNGIPQQTGWSHTPSPPPQVTAFGASISQPPPTATPSYHDRTNSSYSGHLLAPSRVTSPPLSSPPRPTSSPAPDEGKLSISIDFGLRLHLLSRSSVHYAMLNQERPSLVL